MPISDLEIKHENVEITFPHGELDESTLLQPPKGHEEKVKPNQVLKLTNSLYGLKQSPLQSVVKPLTRP